MLIVRTSNRVQDHQRITVFDVLSRETRDGFITGKISRDEHTEGWFDNAFSPVIVLKDNSYLDLIPEGDYLHVARFELYDSMPKSFWTSGEYAITDYAGFDYNKQILYYIATGGNSTQRHVYYVSEKRALRPTKVVSVSESMNSTEDSYAVASLTPDGSFLVVNNNGPDFPRQYLVSTSEQKVFKVLNDGSHLAKKLEGYELPRTEIREITFTANDGKQYNAPIQITFPVGFEASLAYFYPLVVHLYGGPGSQSVSAKWSLGFETVLASSFHEGTVPLYLKEKFHSSNLKEKLQAEAVFNKTKQPPFISLAIDQRGTGMRGLEYMFNVKTHLGENEADDIIRITEAFIKNFTFVDGEKVGFWGWSFGGFLATKIVEKDTKQVFKASVAVAPVIDWKLYDSVYTERYMGLPETNREGYLKSAIFNVSNFNNERYMVIHGTADDNVHFQNTLALLSSLQTYYKPTKDERVVDVISPNMYSEHFVPDDNHAMGLTFQAYPTVHRLVRDFFTDVFRQIDVFRDLTL
jgi:dipeptidyl aminopeptidase